jgi:hypothetical protein
VRKMEVRTALRYSYLALAHPGWWIAFVRGGRAALLRRIVADSVEILRHEPILPLEELVRAAPTTPLGRMGAPQEYLYRLVRTARPTVIVETGVYRGVSSAFILAALHDNGAGRLYSIDLPSGDYLDPSTGRVDASPLYSDEAVGFAVPEDVRDRWTLRLGDVRVELPKLLSQLPSVDLFYHDSEHTYEMMMWEYEQALPHLRIGGLLTSDDTNWNSAFSDFLRRQSLRPSWVMLQRLGIAVASGRVPVPAEPAAPAA